MCGIAGIISHNPSFITEERIRISTDCLQRRGPDESATWINSANQVALGHRRLSIIDLSNAGSQPMKYLDRYVIVHNGEVFNFQELKETLAGKGYSFQSATDTEVIVAAYDAWGTDCLKSFDGMFAFAIWDERSKQLFAARDRFGEKPFYCSFKDDNFCFASEMKTLWTMGIPREVNDKLLYNFLTIGYTSNPGDPQECFFKQIQKLPAAFFLTYSFGDKELKIERYWEIQPEEKNYSDDEAISIFQEMLGDSVLSRMKSDVPIGTSLSGGIDSSSIVYHCNNNDTPQYSHQCFTASFPGFDRDETEKAKKVADQFDLHHHAITMDEHSIADLMKVVMNVQEEPFSSGSVLAQYKVYETARKHGIKVLLDGQGADETLAGYHKFFHWYWQELYRNRRLRATGELAAARSNQVVEKFNTTRRFAALLPEFSATLWQTRIARKSARQPMLNREFAFANKRDSYYSVPTNHTLNGALFFNTFNNGLEELLRFADRNSMAHGVEVRLPFLNHKLVEFLFTLPASFKIRDGWTKWILRKSIENKLSPEIVWHKKKTGFEPPQKKWMQNKEVQEAIMQGKQKLVDMRILDRSVLKRVTAHDSYGNSGTEWRYWSASHLF